jgi:hypothetical protein
MGIFFAKTKISELFELSAMRGKGKMLTFAYGDEEISSRSLN